MSNRKNSAKYPSEKVSTTDTPGVYRRGRKFQTFSYPAGGRRKAHSFETYEEAVAFKLAQPTKRKPGGKPKPVYRSGMLSYLLNDPCAYCGGRSEHIDHIVPQAEGGSNDWSNLVASCGKCNRNKSAKPLLLFLLERRMPSGVIELPATTKKPLFALLQL